MMPCNIDMHDRLTFEIFVCNASGASLVVDLIEKRPDDRTEKRLESRRGV